MNTETSSAITNGASRDWVALIFRPLIISGMATCVTAGCVMALESILSGWRGSHLIWLIGLVTLEKLIVERQIRLYRLAHREDYSLPIYFAEIGVLVVVLKALGYWQRGWDTLPRDIQQWIVAPESFLDVHLMIGVMGVGVMWILAQNAAANLAVLEDVDSRGDPALALQELKSLFTAGLVALLLAGGIQRVALTENSLGLRPPPGNEFAILPLVYVGLGMLLFSQARLSLLLAAWVREDVPITPDLPRRWVWWSLLFVVGVSVLVLFLPAGRTMQGLYLLTWLLFAVVLVTQVAALLVFLVFVILLLPLLLFSWLQKSQELPIEEITNLPSEVVAAAQPDMFFYLRLAVFWILVALVFVYVVKTYWRDRRAVEILKTFWAMLSELLYSLFAWLLGWASEGERAHRRAAGASAPGAPEARLSWWERWRVRNARERVRRLYLTMLQRASQAGFPRQSSQTPYEYSSRIQPHLAEDADALSHLTEAFVQARYSRRDFEPGEVSYLRRIWQRLQSVLRKGKGRASPKNDRADF